MAQGVRRWWSRPWQITWTVHARPLAWLSKRPRWVRRVRFESWSLSWGVFQRKTWDEKSSANFRNLAACVWVIPQIAGSYRGSNFSKGGIVLANWPTSGCCSECCAGCCCGCCPGCSGSCLPLGGVNVLSRVLSGVLRIMFAIGRCQHAVQGAVQGAPDHVCHWGVRVLSRVLSRVLRIMFAIGRCQGAVQGAVQGAPDHVCHWAVSECCQGGPDHVCHWVASTCCPGCYPGCSGSCLPLGGVSMLCRVLSRVLRIMFAIGRCQGAVRPRCCSGCSGSCLPLGCQGAVQVAVQGAPDHVCHWAVSGCWGAVQGAPDHVCHWAVSGCCPGCSGSCLSLGGVRVLSRVLSGVLRIMFAFGRCQGAVQGAIRPGCCQGAPDHICHWAVSGCCPGCCAGVLFRVLRIMFAIGVSACCPRVLSRVLRIMFAIGRCQGAVEGGVQGAVQGCCWGVVSKVLRIMFAMVLSRVLSSGAVQCVSDHVWYWVVSGCCWGCCPGCCAGCCPGCSGSCLRLGGVRVLSRVLCKGQGKQSGTRINVQFLSGVYAGVIFFVDFFHEKKNTSNLGGFL